jgi:hypothetical protein
MTGSACSAGAMVEAMLAQQEPPFIKTLLIKLQRCSWNLCKSHAVELATGIASKIMAASAESFINARAFIANDQQACGNLAWQCLANSCGSSWCAQGPPWRAERVVDTDAPRARTLGDEARIVGGDRAAGGHARIVSLQIGSATSRPPLVY